MSEEKLAQSNTLPGWFKVVAGIALIWNLMGVMAFIAQMMMTPEMITTLPLAEQALYTNVPLWATIAFGCAVWGGALGCLLLVLRKALAFYFLLLSVCGVCVQMYHSFFVSNSFEVFGPGGAIMPAMVIVIAFVLLWFSKNAESKGWIS